MIYRCLPFLTGLVLLVFSPACSWVPRPLITHDPLTSEEHLALGQAYLARALYPLAKEEFQKSIARDPRNLSAHIELGNLAPGDVQPPDRSLPALLPFRAWNLLKYNLRAMREVGAHLAAKLDRRVPEARSWLSPPRSSSPRPAGPVCTTCGAWKGATCGTASWPSFQGSPRNLAKPRPRRCAGHQCKIRWE